MIATWVNQPAMRGGGGPPSRIFPVSGDEFYVVTDQGNGSSIAYRFWRNQGGSDPSDMGTPWEPWRMTGVVRVPTNTSDPVTSPTFTYSLAAGSQDYALQISQGIFKTGGSYHGGETIVSQTLKDGVTNIDPTVAANISSFQMVRTTTVSYGSGFTLTINFTLTILPNGKVQQDTVLTSTAAFASTQGWDMTIGSLAFTEAVVNGVTTVVSTDGTYTFAQNQTVTLRDPVTGRTIAVTSTAPLQAGYNNTTVVRSSSNSYTKLYFNGASTSGAPLGTKTYTATATYA